MKQKHLLFKSLFKIFYVLLTFQISNSIFLIFPSFTEVSVNIIIKIRHDFLGFSAFHVAQS